MSIFFFFYVGGYLPSAHRQCGRPG